MIDLYCPDHLTETIYAMANELGLDEYNAPVYVDYEEMGDMLGACFGDSEAVTVSISEELRGDPLLYALAHEMIHVKQMLSGALVIERDIFWQGDDQENVPYENRVYEREAYFLENVLVERLKIMGVPAIPTIFWKY